MPETAPPIAGVPETAPYVVDMARARDFHERVPGLAPAVADARLTAYRIGAMVAAAVPEGRTRWPRGGTSLCFRDPDGHLGEIATPGIWPNF